MNNMIHLLSDLIHDPYIYIYICVFAWYIMISFLYCHPSPMYPSKYDIVSVTPLFSDPGRHLSDVIDTEANLGNDFVGPLDPFQPCWWEIISSFCGGYPPGN